MHLAGLLPLAIDLAFIVAITFFLVRERDNLYDSTKDTIDTIYSCESLYMTAFGIVAAFFVDGLLYFLALVQQQVWKQYKRRLIIWTMYHIV